MSQSTDGQICYGVLFEEEQEFPWDETHYSGDGIEEWWREESGFVPTIQIYDERGEWKDGIKPPQEQKDLYYRERKEWDVAHPCPVELVNCCSGEFPIWILAVPGTFMKACRGEPRMFDPMTAFPGVSFEEKTRLFDFCKKYGLSADGGVGWFLSSLWD